MTNKEVQAIINEMKVNRLYKRVISEIVSDAKGYGSKNLHENLKSRLGDIAHGLSSGIVGSMIYYSDTCKFFKTYKKEIQELIKEYQEGTGTTIIEAEWFDKDDFFCEENNNQNYLAWFAYETIAFDLMNRLEQ